jgi:hypothetical protein
MVAAFAGCVIHHTQDDMARDQRTYLIEHPDLESVEMGTMIPEYDVILRADEDGTRRLRFEKRKYHNSEHICACDGPHGLVSELEVGVMGYTQPADLAVAMFEEWARYATEGSDGDMEWGLQGIEEKNAWLKLAEKVLGV